MREYNKGSRGMFMYIYTLRCVFQCQEASREAAEGRCRAEEFGEEGEASTSETGKEVGGQHLLERRACSEAPKAGEKEAHRQGGAQVVAARGRATYHRHLR